MNKALAERHAPEGGTMGTTVKAMKEAPRACPTAACDRRFRLAHAS